MFWLVSDEGGGGGGGGAGVALSSLEACCLPSGPGRASLFGCYLQVRYQNGKDFSQVSKVLFVL